MKHILSATAVALTLGLSPAWTGGTPAPEGAEVYFVNIEDGSTVSSPVTVVFGLRGMGVAPAGTEKENTGHHHILINRAAFGEGAEDADMMENGLIADENHVHFGGGQTEVTLDLEPGTHTLQLVLGDLNHVPHDPPIVTEVITVTVE
ncbi:DUF4399 domain-containing protein [Roseovarius sp. 2305UL8-3]|uniref:DUF4399 domain-containing protein n=1 Tax=Roseovarius conchicola TaxID=3121636 RepID=UPI0035297937